MRATVVDFPLVPVTPTTVIALAGRRIDAEPADEPRFPFARVGAVREAIAAKLKSEQPCILARPFFVGPSRTMGSELFRARGFQQRTFDAPIGWFLDKAKLLPPCSWYPVPADGDGLI